MLINRRRSAGASLTNFLSHWLIATTKRDGKYETVEFIEGVFIHNRVNAPSFIENVSKLFFRAFFTFRSCAWSCGIRSGIRRLIRYLRTVYLNMVIIFVDELRNWHQFISFRL